MPSALEAPLRFVPQILPKPWGGGEHLRAFGLSVPEHPPTGEVWLVSDVPGRSSEIADGPFRGRTLADVIAQDGPRLLGRAYRSAGRFPLLVKLLEVRTRLSLQVHPDGHQALRLGDGPTGKFEAWSVLAVSPGARVSLGLDRALTADEVRRLVASNQLGEHLNSFEPEVGDAYVIKPGMVHAASGGVLFLEVQETADVTYRLYDWGQVGLDGKPRELHVDKALEVATLAPPDPRRPEPPPHRSAGRGAELRPVIAESGPFEFEILDLARGTTYSFGGDERPWVVVGLRGEIELQGARLGAGEAALAPASMGRAELRATSGASCALAAPRV